MSALRGVARAAAGFSLEAAVRLAALAAPSASQRPNEPGSLFVLRNNDIGDLLVVTPLFEALRRRFPRASIAAGVGDWNRDVLRLNPHVSEVLPVNAPWFNKYRTGVPASYLLRSPEVGEIARRRFDIGIDVLGSSWGSLLLLRAGIPFRLGVRGYAGGHTAAQRTVDFDPGMHVGRSALRFAELLGAVDLPDGRPQLFLSAAEREEAERWWAQGEGGGPRLTRIVVGPGGGLAAKCWPPESFAELLRGLGTVQGLNVLVLGGPRERELVRELTAACPSARSHPEPPGLREVFALAAAADLAVCNSSMLLHVAAAFSKPAVVLLGESFPSTGLHQAQWGYPGLSRSLGKEPGARQNLYTPAEALAILREEIAAR